MGGFCLREGSGGWDGGSVKSRGEKGGDRYVVKGRKVFIRKGGGGEIYLVLA